MPCNLDGFYSPNIVIAQDNARNRRRDAPAPRLNLQLNARVNAKSHSPSAYYCYVCRSGMDDDTKKVSMDIRHSLCTAKDAA